MFSERMSGKELYEEYAREMREITDITIRFSMSGYVKKTLFKLRKQRTVVLSHTFVARSGNRYVGVMTYSQHGNDRYSRRLESAMHIGVMKTVRGECAVVFYDASKQAMKLTKHFFERYKERLGAVGDWKTRSQINAAKTFEDIVCMLVRRNSTITWIETDSSYNGNVHIFSPINDGVALLQYDTSKKVLQANTFLTEDMLNRKQATMVYYAREYIRMSEAERAMYSPPSFVFDGNCD